MFCGGFIFMQIQNAIHTIRVPFTRVALTYHSLPLLITFFGESTGLGSTVSDWGACSYCCVESVLLSFVSKKFFGRLFVWDFRAPTLCVGWVGGWRVEQSTCHSSGNRPLLILLPFSVNVSSMKDWFCWHRGTLWCPCHRFPPPPNDS